MTTIDLKKVAAQLEEEKKLIEERIVDLKADDPFSDPDYASDNAAVDTDVREQNYHQTLEAEIADLQDRLNHIGVAIKKVEKGQYGYCAKCNQAIPQARLDLVPEAQYCVSCESSLVK